jgi:hypothetical protein
VDAWRKWLPPIGAAIILVIVSADLTRWLNCHRILPFGAHELAIICLATCLLLWAVLRQDDRRDKEQHRGGYLERMHDEGGDDGDGGGVTPLR